jgi:hypothetical protein
MNGNEMAAPQPVPDLTVEGVSAGVSDEDRNRYGVLLDHAAERGLLSAAEYQVRLTELAEATSVEQLQRIVSELPAFGGPAATPSAVTSSAVVVPDRIPDLPIRPTSVPGAPPPELDAALWASLTPVSSRRGGQNPWLLLTLVIVVLLVAMIGLALVADHLTHIHTGNTAGLGAAGLSSLRL